MHLVSLAAVALCVTGLNASPTCFHEQNAAPTNATVNLAGISDFGIVLFKTLFNYEENRNLFFSPYSIWSALSLAYFGSEGETKAQLQRTLGVTNKMQTLSDWRKREQLYSKREKQNEYIFRLANRAYFDLAVNLRPCMQKVLNSETRVVNMTDTPALVSQVNNWVSNATKSRIRDLVSPADVANANMILANAAFFKGTWLYQFKKSKTQKNVFYETESKFKFVPFMTQKGSFRYGASESLGASILELPYTGETVSMLILLPPFITGNQGFSAMVNRLNASILAEELQNLWPTEMTVKLPKFTIEATVGDELKQALTSMGIKDIFDPNLADMTDFSASDNLAVGKTIHKAFVEVSEEGTEAAAATALISFRVARPVQPIDFVADHPFLFLIYDNETENILFMGAYKTPEKL